jgi:hypothetical protein
VNLIDSVSILKDQIIDGKWSLVLQSILETKLPFDMLILLYEQVLLIFILFKNNHELNLFYDGLRFVVNSYKFHKYKIGDFMTNRRASLKTIFNIYKS